MKNKSFLHTLNILLRIQLVLITAVMLVFVFFAYRSASDKQETALKNYLEVFSGQIESQLSTANNLLSNIVFGNNDLELLRSEKEDVRQYAAISLFNEIDDLMQVSGAADIVVVAQVKFDVCIDVKIRNVTVAEQDRLKDFSMEYAAGGSQSGGWNVLELEENIYVYRALSFNQRAVIAFISADTLMDSFPGDVLEHGSFILSDSQGNVLCVRGDKAGISEKDLSKLLSGPVISGQRAVADNQLTLAACQDKLEIFRQVSWALVILFAVILTLWGFSFYFSARIRRELLEPMEDMTRDMERIKNGQYDLQITTKSDNIEFQTLVQSFNKLIDEILRLKIQSYEKQLALMDTEQKFIRLQLRPHFFLNAMTTIVSLSRAGKNEEIETYISALSKNIRYMFSSGLHTVALEDELRHVENYFEMQELKYPGCVLYFIDMAEGVEGWRIPQMLIHTIIENEYKYAVDVDGQLMVLIKLQPATLDGEDMLLIEVEDDGQGYPESVIEAINEGTEQRENDGTRVGLWGIRRLMELMYERKGLFQIGSAEPHGALSRIYIPKHTVNERDRESREK